MQYTAGDVQQLMRSCVAMDSEKGYRGARKLLTKRYGQPYRITSACVERLVKASLRRSRCQDPVVTDYAARYANLLTGYLNVMISEPKASAKDTNLFERKNFAITVLFPVITPLRNDVIRLLSI